MTERTLRAVVVFKRDAMTTTGQPADELAATNDEEDTMNSNLEKIEKAVTDLRDIRKGDGLAELGLDARDKVTKAQRDAEAELLAAASPRGFAAWQGYRANRGLE